MFRKVRKTLISICHVNKRSERLIIRFKVARKFAKEQATARKKAR